MKWNLVFGTLVLSLGLCSQSFGAGCLIDRLLGAKGCGGGSCCEPTCGSASSCCEPSCEAPACDPCGCDDGCSSKRCGLSLKGLLGGRKCRPGCGPSCDPAPSCVAASCGCDAGPSCDSCCDVGCKRTGGLLGRLKNLHSKNCCEPACGAPAACAAPAACNACPVASSCCGGCAPCCRGLGALRARLAKLLPCKRCEKSCCDSGCSNACSSGCGNGCTSGCGAAAGCGGGASGSIIHSEPAAAPANESEVETDVPPAPTVDPSAFLPRGRIIRASATSR